MARLSLTAVLLGLLAGFYAAAFRWPEAFLFAAACVTVAAAVFVALLCLWALAGWLLQVERT